METLKLKRHETFAIREGWLEKAINLVDEDSTVFGKDKGTRELGIGTNMVKSLRYWVQATNLISFTSKGGFLTELGKIILQNDRYLENKFTWWLIHLQLATNFVDAPVINTIYNLPFTTFDKDFLMKTLKEYFNNNDYEIGADSSLDSDVSVYLKMYHRDQITNPEENYNSPLAQLELLTTNDNRTFSKVTPSYDALDYRIVYLSILKCLEKSVDNLSEAKFNIEDLCSMKNNPMTVLNLSRSLLFVYLEDMKKNGLIDLNKTAGLNIVYINNSKNLEELVKEYYEQEG